MHFGWDQLRDTPLLLSLSILSKRDKLRFIVVLLIQTILGFMDLLGVAIIGLLGALSINGVQSRPPGDRIAQFLEFFQIEDFSFQSQAALMGAAAAVLFVLRTIFSIVLSRKVLYFLSRRGAIISSQLTKKMLSQSLIKIQRKTQYENLFALTTGVSSVTLGVLGSSVVIIADLVLLLIMSAGLLLVDFWMALSTIIFFALVGYLLYAFMHKRAARLGGADSKLSIQSNEKIIEVLTSYRESVVRNRRDYYAREIGSIRHELADTLAGLAFMPNVSKYIVESSLVIGALLISAAQFLLQDAAHAIATLSVFLVAGTRIAPAVLRVQQGAIQVRTSLGSAKPTLDLILELKDIEVLENASDQIDTMHAGFTPEAILRNVTFQYPGSLSPAIFQADFEIKKGTVVAIVGPSGAGKTTLIDLILGVLEPDDGVVEISNTPASEVPKTWPGAISYVPQDVMISNGTIRSNITLGFPDSEATNKLVDDAIVTAQLVEFVNSLPDGENTKVGDRGSSLSGGQRQRLGIARALFTKPKLLVLDEATSALDGETEANISAAIGALKGDVTVILIAHRLSTVRDADKVVYLEGGQIIAEGTFDEVRNSVPNFDRQASLMGL